MPRYQPVAEAAGWPLAPDAGEAFDVVERLPGSATTDFGAPGAVAPADHDPVDEEEAARLAALVAESWRTLDRVAATGPAELRKGPRGGGRDRDRVVAHVVESDAGYARQIGVRHRVPSPDDAAAISELREAVVEALRGAAGGAEGWRWPARYAARRIAWHALDHAWEIEDRS